MKIIDNVLLDIVSAEAKHNERLRKNYNFHESLDDDLNRLLNAMQPGTYIPPHRHLNPDKEEICIVLRGAICNFIFNDAGEIIDSSIIDPSIGVYGIEMEPGVWHSAIVLKQDTVVYEIKRGAYAPLSKENMASWAPDPSNKEATQAFMQELLQKIGYDK